MNSGLMNSENSGPSAGMNSDQLLEWIQANPPSPRPLRKIQVNPSAEN